MPVSKSTEKILEDVMGSKKTTETKVESKSKLQESAEKLIEAKKGRQESDIGIGDPYWDLLKEHRRLFNESKA